MFDVTSKDEWEGVVWEVEMFVESERSPIQVRAKIYTRSHMRSSRNSTDPTPSTPIISFSRRGAAHFYSKLIDTTYTILLTPTWPTSYHSSLLPLCLEIRILIWYCWYFLDAYLIKWPRREQLKMRLPPIQEDVRWRTVITILDLVVFVFRSYNIRVRVQHSLAFAYWWAIASSSKVLIDQLFEYKSRK